MKEGIHPNYQKSIVKCACGETFETGSVKSELKVEICSKCHPFYTGKQKLVDTGGRVDKFKKRYGMLSFASLPAFYGRDKYQKPKELLFQAVLFFSILKSAGSYYESAPLVIISFYLLKVRLPRQSQDL